MLGDMAVSLLHAFSLLDKAGVCAFGWSIGTCSSTTAQQGHACSAVLPCLFEQDVIYVIDYADVGRHRQLLVNGFCEDLCISSGIAL